jgi:hypothetical protein
MQSDVSKFTYRSIAQLRQNKTIACFKLKKSTYPCRYWRLRAQTLQNQNLHAFKIDVLVSSYTILLFCRLLLRLKFLCTSRELYNVHVEMMVIS